MTTFINKQEYSAYRSNWKSQYKELSQEIRDKKWMTKEHQRAYSKAQAKFGTDTYGISEKFYGYIDELLKDNKRFQELKQKYNKGSFYYIQPLQKKASAMLEELKEAKVRAQEQYLAAKEQKEMAMV